MRLDRRRGARGLLVATGLTAAGLLPAAFPAPAEAAGDPGAAAFSCASGRVEYVLGLAEIDAVGCVRTHGSGHHGAGPAREEQEARISLPGPTPLARVLYTCADYDAHGDAVTGFTCRPSGFEADLSMRH